MVKKKTGIEKSISLFVEALKKEIPVEKVILFGSCARARNTRYSDIDIIVVSSYFVRKKKIESMQYLFHIAAKVDSRIEPIPATPEELRKCDPRTFLGQAVSSGRVYYSA